MTTARYYTPSGRSIQAKGIEPDIKVEQSKLESVEPKRPMRSEADLPSHLQGDPSKPEDAKKAVPAPVKKDETKKDESKAAPPAKDGDKSKDAAKKDGAEEVEDYQLSYALDLMRGLSLISQRTVN